ncbi:hypothetical protein CR513_50430, partial [Mucuna pruriens]
MDLCLVPNIGLLADFKTIKFDKYKGNSFPRVHLAMYCWKMAEYIYDDKRWSELAAQVQPPITEREMVTMFIDTLPSSYYDRVVGNVASNFADLVVVGKRIELGIRQGKFAK